MERVERQPGATPTARRGVALERRLQPLRIQSAGVAHDETTRSLAQQRGRLLVLGGGGYEKANLGPGWCAVVEALL